MDELEAAFNPRYSNDRYRYTLTHLRNKLSKTVEQLSVDQKEFIKEKEGTLRKLAKENDQKSKEIAKRDTSIKYLRKELGLCHSSLQVRSSEKEEWRKKCETIIADYRQISEHLNRTGVVNPKHSTQLKTQYLQLELSLMKTRLDEVSGEKKSIETFLNDIEDVREDITNSKIKDSIHQQELTLELLRDHVTSLTETYLNKCKELGESEIHKVDLNLDLNRNRIKFCLENVFDQIAEKTRLAESNSQKENENSVAVKSEPQAVPDLKAGQTKQIQDVYNTFQANIADLTDRLSEVSVLLQTEKDVNAKLEDQISDLKKEVEKRHVESDKKKAEVEKRIKSYDELLDRKDKESVDEIKRLTEHIELLQAETRYLKQEKTKSKSSNLKMTERAHQAEKSLAMQEGKLQQLTKQHREEAATLQKQVQHFKEKIKRLEEESNKLKSEISQYKNNTEVQEMSVLLQHEKDQVKLLQKEVRQLKTRISRGDTDKRVLREKVQSLEESTVLLHKEKADIQKKVDEWKLKTNEANVLIENEQKTLKQLKDKVKSQSLELSNVKAALSQTKKDADTQSASSESERVSPRRESEERLSKFKENQHKYERTQSRLSQNKLIIDTQKAKLSSLETENRKLNEELQELKNKSVAPKTKSAAPTNKEEAKNTKKGDHQEIHQDKLQLKVKTLEEQSSKYELKIKELEEINQQLSAEAKKLTSDAAVEAKLRKEKDDNDTQNTKSQEIIGKLNEEINTLKSNIAGLQEEKAKGELLAKELIQLKEQSKTFQSQIDGYGKTEQLLDTANKTVEKLEKENSALSKQNTELSTQLNSSKAAQAQLEEKEKMSASAIMNLESEIKKSIEDKTQLSEELQTLKLKLESQEDKHKGTSSGHEELAEMNMKLLEQIEALKEEAQQRSNRDEPQSKVFFRQKENLQKLEKEKKKISDDLVKIKKKLSVESEQCVLLKEEVERLKVLQKKHEAEIRDLNANEAGLTKTYDSAQKKITTLENECTRNAATIQDLNDKCKKLDEGCTSLKTRIGELEAELAAAAEKQKNTGDKSESLEKELKELKQQNVKLKMVYKTAKLQYETMKKENDAVRSKGGQSDQALVETKALLVQEQERIKQLKEDYDQSTEEKGSLKQNIKSLKEEISDLKIERDKQKDTIDELRAEMKKEKLINDNKILLEENDNIKKELKNMASADKVRKKHADLVEANAEQKRQINTLQNQLAEAELRYEDVNSKVEKAKDLYQKHKETIRTQEARIAIQAQENQTLTKKLNMIKDKDTSSQHLAALEQKYKKLVQELTKSRAVISMMRDSRAGSVVGKEIIPEATLPNQQS